MLSPLNFLRWVGRSVNFAMASAHWYFSPAGTTISTRSSRPGFD